MAEKFSKIKFGDGLAVTDEGGGVILVAGGGGAEGPAGPPGPTGPAGPAGPNVVGDATSSPLVGLLKGNGADIDVATPAQVIAAAGLGKACRVRHSIDQSCASGAVTVLAFDTVVYDTDVIYDVADNTKLTAKTAGLYLITLTIETHGSYLGIRYPTVFFSGASGNAVIGAGMIGPVQSDAVVMVTTPWQFQAGDWIRARLYQDSGVTVTVLNDGNISPAFTLTRIG